MRIKVTGLLCVCLCILLSLTNAPKKIKIYIIGDSTAANKEAKAYPETGWGMELQSFFNSTVEVDNRALNGRSTKSFITDQDTKTGLITDHWKPILEHLAPGDFVLIEFGHNDEKIEKPGIGSSLSEFKSNLIRYVKDCRTKKAYPVLLTPIARRNFKNGVLTDSHGDYPNVTRRVADSLQVPLIDMQRKTESLLIRLGDQPSIKLFNYVDSGHLNYPTGKKDDTHLSPEGAKQVAALVVKGIRENKLSISKALVKQL